MRNKTAGVTLLEVLLVMAIAASLIMFSINLYQQYRADQFAIQLRYNADTVLESLAYYYQANCSEGPGRTLSQTPYPTVFNDGGDLYNDLKNGFLPSNWQPYNPLIDGTAANDGYFVQFNLIPPFKKQVYVCNPYDTSGVGGAHPCSTPQEIPNSEVIIWQVQLAIKMKNPASTLGYLGLSGADCAVNSLPTNAPVNCSSRVISGSANYLVWQRLPSFASPAVVGDQWVSMPQTKEFNRQYTHDPMYELYLNGTGPTTYYLCGG